MGHAEWESGLAQAMRAWLARMLGRFTPTLLLLDEPFAGMEVDLSQRIRVNLARWAGEGRRAIIFTGHEVGPDWSGSPVRRIKWRD